MVLAVEKPQVGFENIGMGEDRGAVTLETAFGQRAVAGQLVVHMGQGERQVIVFPPVTDLAEQMADMAF